MTDNNNHRFDIPSDYFLAALEQDSSERCGYCDAWIGKEPQYCSAECEENAMLALDAAVEDELLYLAAGYELDDLEPPF